MDLLLALSLASESALLASTPSTAIIDELRYAQNISVSVHSITYHSAFYGQNATMKLNDRGFLTVNDSLIVNEATYANLSIVSEPIFLTETNNTIFVFFILLMAPKVRMCPFPFHH